MAAKRLIILVALGLACTGARAQDQEALGLGALPPISPEYRDRIARWSRYYFPQPGAFRGSRVSDPVLIRDGAGRLLWLVCVEAGNVSRSTRPSASTRYAFGFAPGYFTAPRQRNGSPLINGACDERALAFRPFSASKRL